MDSFIGWIGGKRALRSTILERFPQEGIGRYIEVFGGAGWVLFAREPNSGQMEVFNDVNGDLINLYRCMKYHADALERELDWLTSSREQFHDFRSQMNATGLTDIQRAARYFYIIKMSFGSDAKTYATAPKSMHSTVQRMRAIQERLRMVVIEHKDFADLIKVYDRPDALFYLDPPYVETESYYKGSFSKKDHQRLFDSVAGIQGRWLLSYNDCDMIRSLYSAYRIEGIVRRNMLAGVGNNQQMFKEVLISNY